MPVANEEVSVKLTSPRLAVADDSIPEVQLFVEVRFVPKAELVAPMVDDPEDARVTVKV